MISILVATRGFCFTKTDILIDQVRDRFETVVFRTFDKKIPEAQNWLVEQALQTKAGFFLFIEEDVVPTIEQIFDLINQDADICFIDYGVAGWSCSAKRNREILWCGLGATLIKRKVFEKLPSPWFRTDHTLRLNDWQWLKQPAKYGGHDIWFFSQARDAGFRLTQAAGEAIHLKLDVLGKSEVNNGLHQIGIKPKISQYQMI